MNRAVRQSRFCMWLNPPLGMTGEPVTQNGDSVNGTAAVKMDLQLICSSAIVYLGFFNNVIRSEV